MMEKFQKPRGICKMAEIIKIFTIEEFEQLYKDTFGTPNSWDSSAKKIDEFIEKKVSKIPFKFFHDYKLPDTKEDLERKSDYMRIITAWRKNIKDIQTNTNKIIELQSNLESKLELQKKLIEIDVKLYFDYIVKNNSELINIKTESVMDKIHLIRGALYGYSPENIDFFIKNYKNPASLNTNSPKKHKLKTEFGIDTGFLRLTDDQADFLISLLSKNQQQIKQQRNFNTYMEWRNERGMGDD